MPKTTTSPALISLDDLYAVPEPVSCTLETAKGPVTIEMQVQRDRISVDFMSRMFALSERAQSMDEHSPEAITASFDALIPWISELVVAWNLAAEPTEATARGLGLSVLGHLAAAIQGTTVFNPGDEAPEHPNG